MGHEWLRYKIIVITLNKLPRIYLTVLQSLRGLRNCPAVQGRSLLTKFSKTEISDVTFVYAASDDQNKKPYFE